MSLQCGFVERASYQWYLSHRSHGNKSESFSNSSNLEYTVYRSNQSAWQNMVSFGLVVRCISYIGNSPIVISDVTVQGIQNVDYGQKQSFLCSLDTSSNYTWKIDGKTQRGRNNSTEIFAFYFSHPKRVFVECEEKHGKNVARFTTMVCAREDFQQCLRLSGLIASAIFIVFLCIFNVLLQLLQTQGTEANG